MNESERALIDARLTNWGRWSREGRRRGMSNLLPILQKIAMYGDYPSDGMPRGCGGGRLDPVDVKDAQIVETAILQMPADSLTDRRARELLVSLYTHPSMPVGRVYHALNIRRRSVDGLLGRAFTSLAVQLTKLDQRLTR